MADNSYDFMLLIHITNKLEYFLVASQFIRRPTAGNDKPIQFVSLWSFIYTNIRSHFQSMFDMYSLCRQANRDDFSSIFAQSHQRNPILSILNFLGKQDSNCYSL